MSQDLPVEVSVRSETQADYDNFKIATYVLSSTTIFCATTTLQVTYLYNTFYSFSE